MHIRIRRYHKTDKCKLFNKGFIGNHKGGGLIMKKIVILLILLSSLSYSQLSITQGIYTIHTTDEVEFNVQIGVEYNNIHLQYMRSNKSEKKTN